MNLKIKQKYVIGDKVTPISGFNAGDTFTVVDVSHTENTIFYRIRYIPKNIKHPGLSVWMPSHNLRRFAKWTIIK